MDLTDNERKIMKNILHIFATGQDKLTSSDNAELLKESIDYVLGWLHFYKSSYTGEIKRLAQCSYSVLFSRYERIIEQYETGFNSGSTD